MDRQHGFTVCEDCLVIPTQGRQPRDVAHTDRQTCLTAHAARVGARPEIWVKACDLQQGSSRDALRVARVDEVVGDGQVTVGKDPRPEGLVVVTQDAIFWLETFTSGVARTPKTLLEITFVDVLQTD